MEEIYQQFIVELYKHPLNFGKLENATYSAELGNATCGDSIELFIKTDHNTDTITEAKFIGKGCAISQASASLFTGYLKGKTMDELNKITRDDVLGLLKINLTKNPSRMRCALLVFETMKKAIDKKS